MTVQPTIQQVSHPVHGLGFIVDNSIWGSLKVNFSGVTKQVATARVTFLTNEITEYLAVLEKELERVKREGTINEPVYLSLKNDKDTKDIN